VLGKGLGQPALFAIVYTAVASSIYFSLGVVADHALGLTPVVFLVAALFFMLAAMTYVEGASLHPERAGSTVFARYGFNELVSFIAGAGRPRSSSRWGSSSTSRRATSAASRRRA
jgi:APA family basic amino acid/polyamine antiporter